MLDRVKDIFTLGSIRSRVRVAFASIILLLAFSGAMSLFELERVSHDTEEILRASKVTTDLAREMVNALNEQNDAIIEMAVIGGNLVDITPHYNRCVESIQRLNVATERAQQRMVEIGSTPQRLMTLQITTSMAMCTALRSTMKSRLLRLMRGMWSATSLSM